MEWKPTWHYRMIDFGSSLGDYENIRQRMAVKVQTAGVKIRIRLDNRFNGGCLSICGIYIRREADREDNAVTVTICGNREIILQPGEKRFSDPADCRVNVGDTLLVDIWFRRIERLRGLCETWAAHSWQSSFCLVRKDMPEKWLSSIEMIPWLQTDVHEPNAAIGVSQIDVLTDVKVRTVVMFGDSISHMSYYSDALIQRLENIFPGKAIIANAGIGGNRLCHNASYSPELKEHSSVFGPAGYLRFEEDVFTEMKPDVILMLEGINDCTHGYQYDREDQLPDIREYAKRYIQVIETAHRHNAAIYIGTVMPENVFREESWFTESEKSRCGMNDWIRKQQYADGVIDFERIASDPATGELKDGFHLDGLHPNDTGGAEMAALVPLEYLCP